MNRAARTAHLAGYAVLLVVASACGSETGDTGDTGDTGTISLDGDWVLTAAARFAVDDAHPITLTLDGERALGRSACNNYSGDVVSTATTVSFDHLGGTEMACSPTSVMDLEQAYLAALQQVDSAALRADTLTLTGPDTSLSFEAVQPVPDADLTGTEWLLETLTAGTSNSASASSVTGDRATLALADDGTLTGSTGCRLFSGAWHQRADTITVDALASDKRGCPPEVDEQDAQVLAVLGTEFVVAIDGDVLTVTATSGKGLVYRQQ